MLPIILYGYPASATSCPDHKVAYLSYSPTTFNEFCVDYTVEMYLTPCQGYYFDAYNILFTLPKQNFEITDQGGFTLDDSHSELYYLTATVVPGAIPPAYTIKVRLREPGFLDLSAGGAISASAKHHTANVYFSHTPKNFSQLYKVIDGTSSPAYLSDHIYPHGVGLVASSNACVQAQQVIVKGTLIIDEDYCFATSSTYDGRLYMTGDDARIEMANGSQLTLRGAQLRGCDQMWDGILLENGSLETDYGYQAPNRRTLIADAFKGVHLMDGTSANLKGADLINCRYGIYGGDNSGMSAIHVHLDDVRIHGTGALKPYQGGIVPLGEQWDWPMSGIEMENVLAFIATCTQEPGIASSCATVIHRCYRGVTLKNTSANLSGFFIHDLKTFPGDLPVVSNTGLWAVADNNALVHFEGYGKEGHASFDKVATGVRLENVHANIRNTRMKSIGGIGIDHRNSFLKSARLIGNKIETRQYGILSAWNYWVVLDCDDNEVNYQSHQHDPEIGIALIQNFPRLIGKPSISVRNNTLNMPRARSGIYALNNDLLAIAENTINGGDRNREYGIHVAGGHANQVDCNLLTRPAGSVSDPSAGIYIQMMDGGAIRCNDISDYPRGIEYFGMSQGSLMEGNHLTDHKIGLLYDHEGSTGFHGHSGNRWHSQYGDFYLTDEAGAINTGPKELIETSLFRINESADPSFGTSVWSNGIPWFFDQVGTNKVCGTHLVTCDAGAGSQLLDPRVPDSLAWRIAMDSFESPNYGGGAVWTAQRQLYRRLAAAPEYVTPNSEWEDFMTTHATSSVGSYEYIRHQWLRLPFEADQTRDDIAAANQVQDSLITALAEVLIALTETTDTAEQQTLIGQQVDLEISLVGNTLYLDTLYAALAAIRTAHIMNLDTFNQSAPTTEDWMVAQRNANALLFKAALEGMLALDSLELDVLESIAADCPMVLGEGVFQARGLISTLQPGRQWDDASACQMAEPRSSEGFGYEQNVLKVWPNPARDQLFVHLEGESDWNVALFNAFGQPVSTWTLSPGLRGLELMDLSPGFYVLVATDSKGSRINTRITVTR